MVAKRFFYVCAGLLASPSPTTSGPAAPRRRLAQVSSASFKGSTARPTP